VTPAANGVRVRPLGPQDVGAVVDLVHKADFAHDRPPDVLRRLFDYPWARDQPNRGFVLTAGDQIVGCVGAIYSIRHIDGQEHHFCNTSTWYVEPDYRRYSLLLLTALMGLRQHTLVTLTASPEVAQVLEKIGFEVISSHRLFFGPSPRLVTLPAHGAQILDSEPEIAMVLSDEHRRILHDHLPFGCRNYVLKERDGYSYVVTKQRWEKGWFLPRLVPKRLRQRRYPVTDVLFISDQPIATRHWRRLQRRMMRRERTLGVTVEESFLGPRPPAAIKTPHHVHVYRRRTEPRSIDALYSELVLLLPD
jgi:predicted RNA binding protein YcfA (HicA-like mRNA interferase family)